MKPERCLDRHVDRGGEVVTAPDVAELVCHDRFHLSGRKAIHNSIGHQQNRLKYAEYARFAE
jgi:hypothetical protein